MPERHGWLIAALGVLALFVVFHAVRLDASPGWDAQEGYNLDIAWNLLHGRLRMFALTSAFAQHPPLYYAQLALAIRIFGYGIPAIRALAAIYAVLTCVAILVGGRRIVGPGPALWGAIAFTVAPLMLDNTRWGYSYGQVLLTGTLCLWAAWEYARKPGAGRLALAGALAGWAAISEYAGVAWILFVALVALRLGWQRGWHAGVRHALTALGVGLGILAANLLACLALSPDVFLADIATTGGRAGGGNLLLQSIEFLLNYYRLLSFDPWIVLGLVGLALVPAARARTFLLLATALLALIVVKVRPIGPSFHTAVPLLSLLALGSGAALDRGLRALYRWLATELAHVPAARLAVATRQRLASLTALAIVTVAIASPLGMATASDAAGLATQLTTRQDTLLATPRDAHAVAAYIFAHARSGDLVLASPAIAWMFDQPEDDAGQPRGIQGADAVQAVAQTGTGAAFYPSRLPPGRWVYNVQLEHARYVIVDGLLREVAADDQESELAAMLAEVARWPAVYHQGQYTIYERPATARVIPSVIRYAHEPVTGTSRIRHT